MFFFLYTREFFFFLNLNLKKNSLACKKLFLPVSPVSPVSVVVLYILMTYLSTCVSCVSCVRVYKIKTYDFFELC